MKLTTEDRNKLPKSSFGEPGKRAYPMPDASHAANAKARASDMENKGKISESTKDKIDAKADKKLSGIVKAPYHEKLAHNMAKGLCD
jgi:hypothetical protein